MAGQDELIYIVRFQADEASLRNVQAQANAINKAQNEQMNAAQSSIIKKKTDDAVRAGREQEQQIRKVTQAIRAEIDAIDLAQRQRKISADDAIRQYEAIETRLGSLDQANQAVITRQRQLFFASERAKNGFVTLSTSMVDVQTNTKGAAIALGNIGRIAQDLPFGIMGISNNIDPLLVSFRNLRTELGSTGLALRAILKLLGGPLGMVFLLGSILPSAIVIAQSGIMGFGKKSKESIDKATDSVKVFADAVKDSARAGVGAFVESFERSEQQIGAIEKALKKMGGVADTAYGALLFKQEDVLGSLQDLYKGQGAYNTAIADATKQLDPALTKQLELTAEQAQLNDAVRAELENRLAILKADEAINAVLRANGLIVSDYTKSLRSARAETEKRLDAERELLSIQMLRAQSGDVSGMAQAPDFDEFEVQTEAIVATSQKIYNDLALERISLARNTADSEVLIAEERDILLRELAENRLSLGLQDEEAYQQARRNIIEKSENDITELTRLGAQQRIQISESVANAAISVLSGIFGETKGLAIASAIVSSLAASADVLFYQKGGLFTRLAASAAILARGYSQVRAIQRVKQGQSSSPSTPTSAPTIAEPPRDTVISGTGANSAAMINPSNFTQPITIEANLDRKGLALAVRQGENQIKSEQITFST
jgi:hypothetical protein